MRVLQINQCHYRRGGADIVYLNTIDLLREQGHDVACFSTIDSKNEPSEFEKFFIPAVDYRNVSLSQKVKGVESYLYNHVAYENLNKLIQDFKPDIAHVHLFYASLSVSILEALVRNGIPVVHTVHDYRLLCPVNTMMDQDKNVCERCASGSPFNAIIKKCSDQKISQSTITSLEAFYWRKFNSPVKKIDHFHFVSEFCQKKHIQYLPDLTQKTSVFYNFTDLKKNPREDDQNNKYFLYYGRLSSEKGILTLIEVWKSLPTNIKLLIVGEGSLSAYIQDFIRSNQLKNIQLTGYKKGDELYSLINNAYFVIVPSEWYENNPMTIVEAYSLGVPVIGAAIGGIPEIISIGNTGFVFTPKDTKGLRDVILKSFALDEETYELMSRKSEEFAKQSFSKEIFCTNLLSIYETTIKNYSN